MRDSVNQTQICLKINFIYFYDNHSCTQSEIFANGSDYMKPTNPSVSELLCFHYVTWFGLLILNFHKILIKYIEPRNKFDFFLNISE